MALREHQQNVLKSIKKAVHERNRRILVSAPPGFGKTHLALEICRGAKQKSNKVLFTSHRIKLAEQTLEKFKELQPSILQGSNNTYTDNYSVLISTIQTIANREIVEPDIIIIDEVHYAYEGELIQGIFKRFPNAIYIGLSATPVDNQNYLLDGFDTIIDDYQMKELIDSGWLCDFEIYSPIAPDLSAVRVVAGDYVNNDLETVVNKYDINKSIVFNYKKYGEGRKFLCFAVNKNHAKELSNMFNSEGIMTDFITADTPEQKRNEVHENQDKGIIKGIINIDILTTGYDDPSISCIILSCPSKSWRKYIQTVCRGNRIFEGKKNCILIDCAGAVAEHGLPSQRRKFIFKPKISRVVQREIQVTDDKNKVIVSEERQVFLRKIGKLLDLYEGKIYAKEAELMEDAKKFLSITDYFFYRQNSGVMYENGRWVHFTSKPGLPDWTVYYKETSIYFGLEMKLKKGRLTEKQRQTLPEMQQRGVLFFICESILHIFLAIEHIEKNIKDEGNIIFVNRDVYNMPDWQKEIRKKLKLE